MNKNVIFSTALAMIIGWLPNSLAEMSYQNSMGARNSQSGVSEDDKRRLYPNTTGYSREIGNRIIGRCILIAAQTLPNTMELSCPPTEIRLLDENHKEVTSALTENGQFQFEAKKGKSYFLDLKTDKYALVSGTVGPLERGDQVLLKIKKKTPSPK